MGFSAVNPLKPALHAACAAFLAERIAAATTAMQAAQESANSDTKSSAGDKYETGREMATAERDTTPRNSTRPGSCKPSWPASAPKRPATPCGRGR